ncbi:MAG: hypothetical protein ACOC5T_06170 [Elusimicrobiota bacterium]
MKCCICGDELTNYDWEKHRVREYKSPEMKRRRKCHKRCLIQRLHKDVEKYLGITVKEEYDEDIDGFDENGKPYTTVKDLGKYKPPKPV